MTREEMDEQLGMHSQHRLYDIVKRIVDVTMALAGLIAFAPLLLVIIILIKFDSPGPIFYKQKRIGRWGRSFDLLKFRTMYTEQGPKEHASLRDKSGEPVFKMASDPRITRIGKSLRQTSLDELPQLWNILRGEMSLVGPRPHLAYEAEFYKDLDKRRLEVIPGMTGLWQIQTSSHMDYDEMVTLDIWYVEHRSFWLDFKILLQTIPAALRGRGAY